MTLEPIAGATASGRLADSPIMTEPKIAASAVALTRSARSIPAFDMIAGIHRDDIGHRREGGGAGHHLAPDAGAALGQAEEAVDRARRGAT